MASDEDFSAFVESRWGRLVRSAVLLEQRGGRHRAVGAGSLYGALAEGSWCGRSGCRAAEPRARLSRRGLAWALEGIVSALEHRSCRPRAWRRVEHRQRRGRGRGPTGA